MESQLLLVLDDDLMVTEGLACGLERDGRTIITCNDVESAQLIVERLNPSHIVTDVRISGPFGYEGLDFIPYARRHSPDSRIIMMSGDAPEALQLEASERGAVAFLHKPFEIQELEAVIELMPCPGLSSGPDRTSVIRMPLFDEILNGGNLRTFFQPLVALAPGWQPIGYEALARYRSDSPLRHPDILFNYASRKQRLVDLEMACIERSLIHGAPLASAGLLFVNVHPHVLAAGDRLRRLVVNRAAQAGVSLDRVVLEITEQGSIPDNPAVIETVEALKMLGVRFAFDDVGGAYSHFSFLDRIRPAFLKVCPELGTGFEADSLRTKIISSLVFLAHEFHCDLILEGIESEATAAAAIDLGVPFGQGFYFGHPAEPWVYTAAATS